MTRHSRIPSLAIMTTLGLFSAAPALAAPIAVGTYDFGTDTGKVAPISAGFSTGNQSNSSFILDLDAHRLQGSSTQNNSSSGVSYADFQFNPVSDPGFEISTTLSFSPPSAGSNFSWMELLAMGSNSPTPGNPNTFTNGLALRYSFSSQQLSLFNRQTGNQIGDTVNNTTSFNFSNPVDFVFSGIFDGDDLKLTAVASQGTNVLTTGEITLANYANTNAFGNYFAYSGRVTHNASISFDNLSVAVIPEPASLALMGLGGLLMLGRGRRGRA